MSWIFPNFSSLETAATQLCSVGCFQVTTTVKLWRVEPGARFSCSHLVLYVSSGSWKVPREACIRMGAGAAWAQLLFWGSGFSAAFQGKGCDSGIWLFPCCCRSGHPASCHRGWSAAVISEVMVKQPAWQVFLVLQGCGGVSAALSSPVREDLGGLMA